MDKFIIMFLGFVGLCIIGTGIYFYWQYRKTKKQSVVIQKASAWVYVGDNVGGVFDSLPRIGVYRWVDSNNNVFLRKDAKDEEGNIYPSFLELSPVDEFTVKKGDTEKYEKEIKKYKTELDDIQKFEEEQNQKSDKNKEDIIEKLMISKAKLNAAKYGTIGSYHAKIDSLPAYFMQRKRGSFIPLKWNLKDKTVRVADEAVKKAANIARLEGKEIFKKPNNKINWLAVAGGIFFILVMIGNIYLFMTQLDVDDQVEKLQAENIRIVNQYNKLIVENSKYCYVHEKQDNLRANTNPINQTDRIVVGG